MRAAVMEAVRQPLVVREMPDPDTPPNGVRLRVEANGICRTDWHLWTGDWTWVGVALPTPHVLGHEFCGIVDGRRVVAANSAPCGECPPCLAGRANLCEHLLFVNGAYGEAIALPRRLVARNVVRLPASVPPHRAAFAEPLACALLGIERARVESGQSVVVFGHGPLGCLLAMLAAGRKARVIIVGKRGWRFERVRSLRIGEYVDAATSRDVVAEIRSLTGGRGADVTVDATGLPEVWEQAVAAAARGGSVVFFGGCAPGTTVRLDTRRMHYEELTLVGAFHHTPELIRRAVEVLESETLNPDALLTHRMELADVPRALELMSRGDALKVLIEP